MALIFRNSKKQIWKLMTLMRMRRNTVLVPFQTNQKKHGFILLNMISFMKSTGVILVIIIQRNWIASWFFLSSLLSKYVKIDEDRIFYFEILEFFEKKK